MSTVAPPSPGVTAQDAAQRLDHAPVADAASRRSASHCRSLDLAAVGVEDAHPHVGCVDGSSRINWSQPMPVPAVGDRARARRVIADRALARVEHDEVVAEAVHLGEGGRAMAAHLRARGREV